MRGRGTLPRVDRNMQFRLRRLVMTVLVGLAAGVVVAVVLIRVLENRFIFFPPRYPDGFADPTAYGLHPAEVWVTSADGVKLNCWFVAAPSSSKVLLVFHGNAENLGYGLERLKTLAKLGVNLFAVDYRGYGKSEGSPDEAGVYRDAEAAHRFLLDQKHFMPRDIIIFGQSLGGAVAIDLASRQDCGGLIVESTFTSARDMARLAFRIPLLEYVPKSRFDSLHKIPYVRAPVLVIHGTRDEVIPFSMGRRLSEAAREPKRFFPVEGAGHNNVFLVGGPEYLETFRKFVLGGTNEGMPRGKAGL